MKKLLLIVFLINIYANELGNLLLNGNCTMCHYIDKDKSAPSFIKVKKAYKKAFPKKNDFIKFMKSFILNPTKDKSILSLEVKKYGLMPKIAYDEETIKIIVNYIYETNFKNISKY